MDKLATLWAFVCRRKYLITLVVFVVISVFWMRTALCAAWAMRMKSAV